MNSTNPAIVITPTLFIIMIGFCIIVIPVSVILILRSQKFKAFRFWITKTPHCDAIMIDQNGLPKKEVKALERLENGQIMIKDGKYTYPYEPIAINLAMIENRNAIPVMRGGYIEEKTIEEALKSKELKGDKIDKSKIVNTETSTESINPDSAQERQVQKVFKWVMDKGKLKNCLIRPYTKYSSKELKDAIKGEVVKELLRIPVSTMDLVIIIVMVASIGITAYFCYTMTQSINELQNGIKQIIQQIAKNQTVIITHP